MSVPGEFDMPMACIREFGAKIILNNENQAGRGN